MRTQLTERFVLGDAVVYSQNTAAYSAEWNLQFSLSVSFFARRT